MLHNNITQLEGLMKISGIQYLRAIAAIAVVIDHAVAMANFDKYFGQEAPFYDFWVSGSIGVNLFFIISGFIIVVSSYHSKTLIPRRTLTEYFSARAIRILPMMWLAIITYAALRLLGRGVFDLQPYLNAMFLLPFGEYDPNNMWTLRHEAIFYLCFGFCFLLSRHLWFAFALWIALPFVLALLDGTWHSGSIFAQTMSNVLSPVNILFGAGTMVGLFYQKYPERIEVISKTRAVILQHWWMLSILFMLVMLFSQGREVHSIGVLTSLPLLTAIVFFGSFDAKHINQQFYYLGNASFSIYLFHPHLESAALGTLSSLVPTMPIMLVVVIVSTFSIIVGCGIYSCVEKPLTKYIQNLLYK